MKNKSLLFQKKKIRGVELKNKIVVSPMCQYSASDGFTNEWHMVHLGKFAQGGAGLIFTEAAAICDKGRITHGDIGIWKDSHIDNLKKITGFIKSQGSCPAIQLAHAGRKACMQRPWHGNGPLNNSDFDRKESVWEIVAPSPIPMDSGWLKPHELSLEDIEDLKKSWVNATLRAEAAGFEVVELHCAHGYLCHEFLSPLSNIRTDEYGGSFENRMKFILDLAKLIRENWPTDKPFFVRVSAVDGFEGGLTIEDTIALAMELKKIGVDVMDCSSGGLIGSATAAKIRRGPGFQVPFSEQIKHNAKIDTMAVGLITKPEQAEEILDRRQADLIAIGREILFNPNWANHAAISLDGYDSFNLWPEQYGWWLEKRQIAMEKK